MTAGVLGVVLAGGRSTRFGTDKALASLAGDSLLDLAIAQLSAWCDEVVVVGRNEAFAHCIPDWPEPDMGPLGGIAAGLRFARKGGWSSVMSCGVDSLGLPHDLLDVLTPSPAFLASQPVIGHWPVQAVAEVERMLTGNCRRSMHAFANAIGARPVTLDREPSNVNTQADLDRLAGRG